MQLWLGTASFRLKRLNKLYTTTKECLWNGQYKSPYCARFRINKTEKSLCSQNRREDRRWSHSTHFVCRLARTLSDANTPLCCVPNTDSNLEERSLYNVGPTYLCILFKKIFLPSKGLGNLQSEKLKNGLPLLFLYKSSIIKDHCFHPLKPNLNVLLT